MKIFWVLVLVVGCAGVLHAEDIRGRWGVGAGAGYVDALSPDAFKQNGDGQFVVSGWIRHGIGPRNESVVALDDLSLAPAGGATAPRVRLLTLGLWHPFTRSISWTPYVGISAGAAFTRNTPAGAADGIQPAGKIFLGFERRFGASWALTTQLNYNHLLKDGNNAPSASLYSVTMGFSRFFYCGRAIRRMPMPTATAVKSAAYARPTAVVMDPDADGDGVSDLRDNCPDSPQGEPVDALGCPRDVDNDGVLDAADRCPDTPEGALVDSAGCVAKTVKVRLDVKFDAGQALVKGDFQPQLQKLADFMNRFPNTMVVIEGHTDNRGNAAANKTLSQKRAEAVRQDLIKGFEIPADRLTARGFGDKAPVADNRTPEGRAANRRVVAVLTAVTKE